MSLQADVNDLVRKLNRVADNARRESQAAFREGAKPLVEAIQAHAPTSEAPHDRYKGGKVFATYRPGNLRRSFRALTFRQSAAVFVGAKLDKTGSGGVFAGNRADGYYAHMVEFGTINQAPQPFVRPAAQSVGPVALSIAAKALKKRIDAYAARLAAGK